MKNRFSKMANKASWMLALLAACGLTSSCKDEYTLDDKKPSWLNSSIYESLQEQGKYKTYLRLLSDADVNPANARPLSEVLSRTGSKTVFVADDDAWKEFFEQNALLPENNPWHTATSYENLSASQKKLLIHTSMLNNAIVMENLASTESSGTDAPTRGEYIRRYTDVESTDTITFVSGNDLPVNYNEGNKEKDYWARFRSENGGKGLYMVNDSSLSMMIHFTNEYMRKSNITDEDFTYMTGQTRRTGDVHIYSALLESKDGVCENGYVNATQKVITPLPNMAELLRTNGKTNIFSHMLERWSAPFYNRGVTEAYRILMASRGIEWQDSIFTKRYFSNKSWPGRPGNPYTPLTLDPNGQSFRDAVSNEVFLKFDPGWNGYYDEVQSPQYDMAAMYVPNDEALWKYFSEEGAGWQLIQTYYIKAGTAEEIPYEKPTTLDELYRQIDQIPISSLKSLINIGMCESFSEYVPSKMTRLRDDAQEQVFYPEDKDHIVDSKLACNGMIYIMDKVYGPADFTSVAAPAYISKTNNVIRWAIYNGSDAAADYMGLNYYAYLKAMKSKFAFFLPSDKAMQYYYDPVSFKSAKMNRMLAFAYKSGTFPITCNLYTYDPSTGTLGKPMNGLEKVSNDEVTNRLKDILESHTIVLDGMDNIDNDIDEYYIAKNGAGIKVERQNGKIVNVKGGFQLENEAEGITGSIGADNNNEYTELRGVTEANVNEMRNMYNGNTYILDAPMIPASRSVYSILTNGGTEDSEEYGAFYQLTKLDSEGEDIIKKSGLLKKAKTATQQKTEMKKYQLFVDDKGLDYNVQFFNNFNYTLFVPTNQAIEAAIQNGMPTWESIKADFEECEKDEQGNLVNTEDSLRLQAKITYLANLVRYHFTDVSVFADQSKFEPREYVTSSYDNESELFVKVNMQRVNPGELQVKDSQGGQWIATTGKVNVMTRDLSCSDTPVNKITLNGIKIQGSSFAVIHQIPGVLNHVPLVNGRYDAAWATPAAAKAYLKKYAIQF